MENRSEPEFYRTVRRKSGRGYGPCDFEEFDRYSACSGHGRLGKVDVSCRFRFEESEWGMIGTKKQGCIIYMDVSFGVQVEHVLQSATILVTLESLEEARAEEQQALHRLVRQKMFPLSVSAAQFTHFGPHTVKGSETEADVFDTIGVIPHVEAAGFGLGGMGWSRLKNHKQHSRWEFTGQLLGEDDHASFRTLQWVLKENQLDSPSNHPNEFHTAFALVHGGESFFIRVQIQGKLFGLKENVKQKLHKLKFGVSGDKGKQSTLTLVSLDGVNLPRKQLLSKAKGLKDKLAELNGAPREDRPDTLLGPHKSPKSVVDHEEAEEDEDEGLDFSRNAGPMDSPQPRVSFASESEDARASSLPIYPGAPSLEELANAHDFLHQPSRPLLVSESTYASSVTLIDREASMDCSETIKQYAESEGQPGDKEEIQTEKSKANAEWRRYLYFLPFFLFWTRLFMALSARRLPPLAEQAHDAARNKKRSDMGLDKGLESPNGRPARGKEKWEVCKG